MPPNRWEDIRDDLFEIVYKLIGPLASEDQAVVEREMQARGYDIKWNAIRYPGRVIMVWDQAVHEDLLVCLVSHLKPEGRDYAAITEMMRAKGYTFSEGALTYVLAFHFSSSRLVQMQSLALMRLAPTNWDWDAHLALLQAVMEHATPTQPEWEIILEAVAKKGYKYTASAAM
ncbi:hypothetical protein QBC44DRAFT_398895, partial [Cladorrhinum sp. PSN332]